MYLIDSLQYLIFEDNHAIDPTVENAVMMAVDTNTGQSFAVPDSILSRSTFDGIHANLIHELNKESEFTAKLDARAPLTLIVDRDAVVGCFLPEVTIIDNTPHHRDSYPFMFPEHRGKGIYSEVMKFWYRHRKPAIAHIYDHNEVSIRLYEKLGFRKDAREDIDGVPAHIYFLK